MWVQSLSREDPLEEVMATHSSFLPGESHGQNSLANNLLTQVHNLTFLLSLFHASVIYKITLELDQALCWLWAWPYKRYGCIHGKLKKSKKEKYRSDHFSTLK